VSNGIYTAMAGAVAQSDALDTTANNIANAGTTGYRAERVRFGEELSRAKGKEHTFVSAKTGITDTHAGPQTDTGNPLDLAIHGDGYFTVQTPQGERLTRAGNFQLDGAGQLTTHDGYAVKGVNGKPIVAGKTAEAAGKLSIDSDGTVSAGATQVGKIDVRNYDAKDLKREGSNYFSTTAKPIPGKPAEIGVGQLEGGNFNVVTGMVDLVRISRTYESLHKMIEGQKAMDDQITKVGQ
jgi:flagellar basal-body rod protein FlgF